MRLYSIYFICKENYQKVLDFKVNHRIANGSSIKYISNWHDMMLVLSKLTNVDCLKEAATKFYESVPIFVRERDNVDIDILTEKNIVSARDELVIKMKTIIDLYESMKDVKTLTYGFDIKLPDFKDIKEFSSCIKDIEFIINQCPFLRDKEAEIKYNSTDVGSTWLTFFVIGAGAISLLTKFSKLIDQAVQVKSHLVTVKQQEEILRTMTIQNDAMSSALETFRIINDRLVLNCINNLEDDLGKLDNGEEIDKVGKSLEKMADWMNKGLQIFSPIDAPTEAKVLFSEQEEQSLLSNDIIKLIEAKTKTE